MGIKCGDLYLQLSEHCRGHTESEVYIFVDDIAQWLCRLEEAGVALESGPTAHP
ncbi:MAG: hypothetical protein ACI81R_003804 [Bradymonadia bacterium]|jgi:hypothetical protein